MQFELGGNVIKQLEVESGTSLGPPRSDVLVFVAEDELFLGVSGLHPRGK
jgi:flagellar biogenesis protein FliO